MQDNPNEALSMEELVLKIQNGEEDPLLLTIGTRIKIVQYLRTHPDGEWKYLKIAPLIGRAPRTAMRYWKEALKMHSVVVDGEWLKSKMAEEAFEYKRQYDRLIRMSYSAGLSESLKARVIGLALNLTLRSSDQKWKQYYDRERLAEKAEAETRIKVQEIAKKQKEAEPKYDDFPDKEIRKLAPIEHTEIINTLERWVLVKEECYFGKKDFENDEKTRELLEAIKKDDLGLIFNEADDPIRQLNTILRVVNFPAICLERKKIEYNHLDRVTHDRLNSLLDRFAKDIAGKEYDQLSVREYTDLMELNRHILERVYDGKCPKSERW